MGTTFWDFSQKLLAHVMKYQYRRVIATLFDEWEAGEYHYDTGLVQYIQEYHEFGYGWEYADVKWFGTEPWCEGGVHSEVIPLPEWLVELDGAIYLAGAFDGECIEDMETALQFLGKQYHRLNNLIV